MSVQPSAARPTATPVGAAVLGLLLTLAAFVVTILAFVTVPLLLFAVALVAYLLLRPRGRRASTAATATTSGPSAPAQEPTVAPGRFGSGAR